MNNILDVIGHFLNKIYESIFYINSILTKKPITISSIAIFFPEYTKLLINKLIIKRDYIYPKLIPLMYDVFPVLITEAGIVRGIRYSGQRVVSPEGYIEVYKFELGRLSQKLCPTFITQGLFKKKKASIEYIIASFILSHIPKLLAVDFQEKSSSNVTALFPSPLTAMSAHVKGHDIVLAPFTAYAILYFTKAYRRYNEVLGQRIECLSIPIRLILHNGIDFRVSAPFRGVLPFRLLENDPLLKKAYNEERNVLTSITGMLECHDFFVASSTLWQKFKHGKGEIIILGYTPLDFRITALFEVGEVIKINQNILKPEGIWALFLTINKERLKKLYEKYSRLIMIIRRFTPHLDILELTKEQAKLFLNIMTQKYGLLFDNKEEFKILTPPLLSLHVFHKYDIMPLLKILLAPNDTLEKRLELAKLIQKPNTLNLSLLIRYQTLIKTWITAVQEQKALVNMGLFQTF